MSNTAALLARFKNAELERAKAIALKESGQQPPTPSYLPQKRHSLHDIAYGSQHKTPPPWNWMTPLGSMTYLKLQDGTGWVRVQRVDGKNLLVPWPVFEGWDETFPASRGTVSAELGGYRSTK